MNDPPAFLWNALWTRSIEKRKCIEEISENRCTPIATALNPIIVWLFNAVRNEKEKKISILLRYWFSFDGLWLGALLSRYLELGCCFDGFFCQGNTKFRVFLLFLSQTNKLPTTHYSSLPYRCAIGLAME